MVLDKLATLLLEKEARLSTLDGDARLQAHAAVLRRKRMLADVFTGMNRLLLALETRYQNARAGARVELGAGVAPLRLTDPAVKSSDVMPAPHLDLVVDAQQMPFRHGGVKTLFGKECFHHFPEPLRFFREAIRVLPPGGVILLIDPYYGPLASMLYKRMFASETFDKRGDWESHASGPMNGANQALSYVVFVRDRDRFERECPELEIVHMQPLRSYLRYLLSGGLNFRQFVPDLFVPLIQGMERLLAPIEHVFALHHVIVLRRR